VPRYAAFLRGINLGPRRRIDGAELRSIFEGAGLDDVSTFRASGNVVFSARSGPAPKLAQRIEKALAEAKGFDVGVFLRTAAEVRAVAANQRFEPARVEASEGKLQVAFLAKKPSARAREQALALATAEDQLVFGERELYWLPSGGIRDSGLDMKAIDALVGPTTVRTMGTVEQIAAKFFAA
jgi:uncharacterized protein (DUF1697 family)